MWRSVLVELTVDVQHHVVKTSNTAMSHRILQRLPLTCGSLTSVVQVIRPVETTLLHQVYEGSELSHVRGIVCLWAEGQRCQ